jgi:predicted transport protein
VFKKHISTSSKKVLLNLLLVMKNIWLVSRKLANRALLNCYVLNQKEEYMVKALQTMIENIPKKTGKKLEDWIHILDKKNFEKHSMAVNFLKTEHDVTHGFANTIVTLSKKKPGSPDDLVSNQYIGKETLKPNYEMLLSEIKNLGGDILITPKKGSVSFIRKKQFALIKPTTKTRIDLGLKLKGIEVQGRLEDSGPFGAMCSHRIQLKCISDVDKEVINWISKAYETCV